MKLKGVNWFESNVEKVAIGVAALALAGTFGLQMFTQPNTIKVGTETLTPAHAVDPVNRAAQLLDDQTKAADPKLPPAPDSNLLAKLTAGMTSPVAPASRFALGRAPGIGEGKGTGAVEVDFAALQVPAPTDLAAVPFGNTIHPLEVAQHPDLAAMVSKEQPYDKQAVTVGATFNASDLRAALLADPDGDGPISPIPQAWWRNPLNPAEVSIDILAVQMERETISPAEDSKDTPGTVVKIAPMPGREDALRLWTISVKALGDVGSGLSQVRAMGEQVTRPPYYATVAGQPWAEPSVLAVQVKEGDAKVAAAKLVEKDKKDLETLNKKLEELKAKVDAAPEPSAKRDRDNPPPPPGGKRGTASPGATNPPPQRDPNANLDKRALQAQLKQAENKRAKIVERLAAAGVKDVQTALNTAPGGVVPTLAFLDNPEVKIWSHDVTAVPGASYRYRMRVVVNNPFFGRQLRKSQEKLAENSYLEGPWSEWSNPVEVDRNDYFFITAASDGSGNALSPRPHASAELFKFYYGFWRKASIGADPGDKLEGSAKLPELQIFDVSKLAAADPNAPAPGAVPPPPGQNPPPPGRLGRTARTNERGPQPPPGQAPGAVAPALPPTGTPLPRDFGIAVDAYFLDAYRLPIGSAGLGGNKDTIEAILRGVGGNVISRIPEFERSQDRYKRLELSAHLGLTQGKPEAKNIDTTKAPPPPPPTEPKSPKKPIGPGGG